MAYIFQPQFHADSDEESYFAPADVPEWYQAIFNLVSVN